MAITIEKPKRKVSISFRLDPDLLAKLRKIAEVEEVHLTQVLEGLLNHAVKAYQKEKGINLNEESED
jgi:uncharacterized protein (DUF1778 family)